MTESTSSTWPGSTTHHGCPFVVGHAVGPCACNSSAHRSFIPKACHKLSCKAKRTAELQENPGHCSLSRTQNSNHYTRTSFGCSAHAGNHTRILRERVGQLCLLVGNKAFETFLHLPLALLNHSLPTPIPSSRGLTPQGRTELLGPSHKFTPEIVIWTAKPKGQPKSSIYDQKESEPQALVWTLNLDQKTHQMNK